MADALTDISLNKLPPYNKEAEQSVLGACLHSEDAIAKVLEILREEDFYKSTHKKIFAVMRGQFEANEPIDVLALADQLRKKMSWKRWGVSNTLAFLKILCPLLRPWSTTLKSSERKKSSAN
jgi:replicative DNA helicase